MSGIYLAAISQEELFIGLIYYDYLNWITRANSFNAACVIVSCKTEGNITVSFLAINFINFNRLSRTHYCAMMCSRSKQLTALLTHSNRIFGAFIMKVLALATISALVAFSTIASANDVASTAAQANPTTEQYNAHKGLDIAKVKSIKNEQDPEKVEGLINSTMIYVDGSGHEHSLEYQILGNGHQNG
jgi:hypothetical protein